MTVRAVSQEVRRPRPRGASLRLRLDALSATQKTRTSDPGRSYRLRDRDGSLRSGFLCGLRCLVNEGSE